MSNINIRLYELIFFNYKDWIDCVHKCESGGNRQECHQDCQKLVHGCLGECPKILCLDHCRVSYEKCRTNEDSDCDEEID